MTEQFAKFQKVTNLKHFSVDKVIHSGFVNFKNQPKKIMLQDNRRFS